MVGLWFIAKPLFWLLTFIQGIVSNWGLAIICVTIVVKAILYPLTKAQYTSMAKMRILQPKMQEMRERFGDDRQRMSQEMMKLYKEEKSKSTWWLFANSSSNANFYRIILDVLRSR